MGHMNNDNPWWKVELKKNAYITKIVVWNRTDGCGGCSTCMMCSDRLSNSQVKIIQASNNVVAVKNIGNSNNVKKFEVDFDDVVGRTEWVMLSHKWAALPEVQVFGEYAPLNLALEGVASQSSTLSLIYIASNAIDGSTISNVQGTLAIMNNDNPWWKVVLKKNACITKIVVWNRTDGCGGCSTCMMCSDRLSNSQVKIIQASNNVVAVKNIGNSNNVKKFEFDFDDVVGRTVWVMLRHKWAALPEVQVFGYYE